MKTEEGGNKGRRRIKGSEDQREKRSEEVVLVAGWLEVELRIEGSRDEEEGRRE